MVLEDTADVDLDVLVVEVVDVTTVPDAWSWFAPMASIIDTSSTVAPLMKISFADPPIWNNDPNTCPD